MQTAVPTWSGAPELPSGLRPEDNELGWRISTDKLARLVEKNDPS